MNDERPIDLTAPLDGVRYEKSGGIAVITIDRPERGNALKPSMQRLFRAIWSDVSTLVASRRDGKLVYYRLSDDHIRSLFGQGLEHALETGRPL